MSDFPDTMFIAEYEPVIEEPSPAESPPAEPPPVGLSYSECIGITRLNESDYESDSEYDYYEAVIEEPSEEVSNSVNCCKYDHASIVGKMESLAQNGHITEQEYIDWAMLVKEHWESAKRV